MKRFTETKKWDDSWFWELSTPAKLLYLYLLDHCDNAGVVDCNLKLVSFKIGEPVDAKTISELGDRLQRLPNGKLHLTKFVRFQYGDLKPGSNLHNHAISLLKQHGLPLPHSIDLSKPSVSPTEDLHDPSKKGTGTGTVKVQAWDGGKGETKIELLREGLCGLYDRKPGAPWSYAEESAMIEVVRRRDCLEELADLRNYARSNGKYFPKSIVTLLSDWTKHLDAAASYKREARKAVPGIDTNELAARKRQAQEALQRAKNHKPD